LKYEKQYTDNGIDIVYVAQPEMNSKIVKMIYAVFAEQFLDNLSFEVTKGMIENAHKSKRNGGVAPYGYKLIAQLDDKGEKIKSKSGNVVHNVFIDPEQAEGVKLMFQMTIDGHTRAEIIRTLNSKGYKQDVIEKVTDDTGRRRAVKNGKKKSFTGTSIDNILRNERYTGEYDFYYNKGTRDKPVTATVRVTNEFQPIISKDDFEAVQKILKNRKHRPPCNAEENYLLTGKVICGECGNQYNGMRCKRHGKWYVYYKCTNQASYSNGKTQDDYCHNNTVRKEDLEQFVIDEIKKVVFNENFIDQVYEQYNLYARSQTVNNSMVDMLKNKLAEIDESIKGLLGAIESGYATPTLFARLKHLESVKDETHAKLAEETSGNDYIPASKNDVVKIYNRSCAILDGNDIQAKKYLIQNFVNKIVVRQNKVEVFINLIPTTCCAKLDLDILDTHLFSGELDNYVLDVDIPDGTASPKNLKELADISKRPDARFRIDTDYLKPAPDTDCQKKTINDLQSTKEMVYNGLGVQNDGLFTMDNHIALPHIIPAYTFGFGHIYALRSEVQILPPLPIYLITLKSNAT